MGLNSYDMKQKLLMLDKLQSEIQLMISEEYFLKCLLHFYHSPNIKINSMSDYIMHNIEILYFTINIYIPMHTWSTPFHMLDHIHNFPITPTPCSLESAVFLSVYSTILSSLTKIINIRTWFFFYLLNKSWNFVLELHT